MFAAVLPLANLSAVPLPGGMGNLPLYGIAGGAVILFALLIVIFSRGKKKEVDPEAGLSEDLASLPPPPKGQRHYRLLVQNQPARLRLVVVAPMGKRTVGKVDSVLEQIFRGLGEVAVDDKPRVRIWPPQLSAAGFAPTFFRKTRRPEPEGQLSTWILLAGPARAGNVPVLLGLAVQTDQPSRVGTLILTETQWNEILRIETA
jgi:hypothetical protein